MDSLSLGTLRPLQAMAAAILFKKRRLALCLPRQIGGKTELGVRLAHSLTSIPKTSSSLFLAKSHRAAKKAIREKYLRLFDKKFFAVNTEIVYNKKCPSSCVFIDSVDKDPDRIRGGTYDFVHWSEVAFSKLEGGVTIKDVFDKVINPAVSEHDGFALLESTNNGKNGWYDFWESAADFGFSKLRVSLSDMVYLGLVNAEDYDKIKSTTQPDVFRQEWECDWVTFAGRVYEEFTEKRVIKDMEGPGERDVIMGIDWGFHPGATCVLFSYVKNGCLYVFDEHYIKQELPIHTADKIHERAAFWNYAAFSAVADHDPSKIKELQLRKIPCTNADKVNVLGNRMQIKELLFQNRLFISSRCPYLIRDLFAAVWSTDPKKANVGEIDESQCTWGHFDGEAALRYLVRRYMEIVEDTDDADDDGAWILKNGVYQ